MSAQDIIQTLQEVPTTREKLRQTDFEGQAHAGGSGETVIFDHKVVQPFALRQGARYRFVPVVRESFTTDSTTGNSETFALSNDLIDSDVADNVLVYEDGNRIKPDSVDFGTDDVTISDSGSNSDVRVYYVSAEQASVKLRKVAPGGTTSESLVEFDAALSNRRDPNRDPRRFALNDSQLQPVFPRDYRLQWTIDGPFNAGYDESSDPTPVNNLISIPIQRSSVSRIDGLSSLVNRDMADRI